MQQGWKKEPNFPHVMLTKIFTSKFFKKKSKEVKKLFYRRESQPDSFSYATAKATSLHIFDQKELHERISNIIQRKVQGILGEAYYYSWKDFTVINKKTEKKSAVDIIIDFTEEWKEEYGGSIMYKNNKGQYIKFLSAPNSMIIIERKNTQKYIQYINNFSKGKKRYLLIGTVK